MAATCGGPKEVKSEDLLETLGEEVEMKTFKTKRPGGT